MESSVFLQMGPPHRVTWVLQEGKKVISRVYIAPSLFLYPANWQSTKDGYVLQSAHLARYAGVGYNAVAIKPTKKKLTTADIEEIITTLKQFEEAI